MARSMLGSVLLGILIQTCLISAKLPDWVPPEIVSMVADDKARCMQEHGTTEALIDQVNSGTISNERALTCYMYCLFESFSVIDEDGVLEADMLAGFFPGDMQAKGKVVLNACAEQSGADNCEKVYNIATCVQSKEPELWFMV